jgi:DNA-binding transcriptional regulator PaaX
MNPDAATELPQGFAAVLTNPQEMTQVGVSERTVRSCLSVMVKDGTLEIERVVTRATQTIAAVHILRPVQSRWRSRSR